MTIKKPMPNKNTHNTEEYICRNCGTKFQGNFCPQCGQSIKEFERPFQFLIIDFLGNMFAFDTRFWKTFVAVLLKPGTLARDYVKGHRIRYMPPFRFYIFVSFIFFFLLNIYTSQNATNSDLLTGSENDMITLFDNGEEELTQNDEYNIPERIALFMEHPELFMEQLMSYYSWGMFLLMPFYGFLLWVFYRKRQRYYITHLIMAVNQHAFIFSIFIIMLLFSMFLPGFSGSFINYLLLLIPVYLIIGHKILYQQRTPKIILKLFAISFLYFFVVLILAVAVPVLILVQNGLEI